MIPDRLPDFEVRCDANNITYFMWRVTDDTFIYRVAYWPVGACRIFVRTVDAAGNFNWLVNAISIEDSNKEIFHRLPPTTSNSLERGLQSYLLEKSMETYV